MELVIPVVAILIGLGLRAPADLSLTPEAGARAPPDMALPGRAVLAVLFSREMPGNERQGVSGEKRHTKVTQRGKCFIPKYYTQVMLAACCNSTCCVEGYHTH